MNKKRVRIKYKREVHSHTHTPRKKWTHYFWEFLMLFLAVFCGFLAEYQLEHKIERDREKQFIKSLVNDIIADTIHLNTIIKNRTEKISKLDSLRILLKPLFHDKYTNDIYYNAIHAARRVDIRFTPNNGTLQQLKNAGGLRLIQNRSVVDSITKYDVSVRNLESLGDLEETILQNFRMAAHKVFNSDVYDSMLDDENVATRPTNNPALLSFDSAILHELNFNIYTIKLITKGNRRDAKKLLTQSINLLSTLKKE